MGREVYRGPSADPGEKVAGDRDAVRLRGKLLAASPARRGVDRDGVGRELEEPERTAAREPGEQPDEDPGEHVAAARGRERGSRATTTREGSTRAVSSDPRTSRELPDG